MSEEIVLPPLARGRRRLFQPGQSGNSVKGPYSTWRKNFPVDFLQMQEAESRRAIFG
jgi:hypothetical protein